MTEFFKLLLILCISGAFGGFLSALRTSRGAESKDDYFLPCPLNPKHPKQIQIGFFADILLGCGAGLSSFILLAGALGLNINQFSPPDDLLRLVAMGIVAGFMGPALLKSLAVTFQTLLIEQKTKLGEGEQKLAEVEAQLRDVKDRNEKRGRCLRLVQLGDAYTRWEMPTQAIESFDQALKIDPTYIDALIHKSFVFAKMGEEEKDPAKKEKIYTEAIKLVDQTIKLDPQYARSYYNRACYTFSAYKSGKKNQVLADLKMAIDRDRNDIFAEMAKSDPDFIELRHDEEFKKLVRMDGNE